MDVAALIIALASLVTSLIISGSAVRYARRADRRSGDAEARAVAAEDRERRSFEHQQARFRIAALERVYEDIHGLSHAEMAMLSGDVRAMDQAQRIRARLPAALSGVDAAHLPFSVRIAEGSGGVAEYGKALSELTQAIAAEHRRAGGGDSDQGDWTPQ